MDNRRLIISIVICIALMLGWQAFAQHMGWLPEPTQQAEQVQPVEQAQPEVMAAAPAAPVAKFEPSAGREVRVIVTPEKVHEGEAQMLAKDICQRIEKEMNYPGQIKVTIIRETRSVEYAK